MLNEYNILKNDWKYGVYKFNLYFIMTKNIYDFLRGKKLEEDMDMSQEGGRTL